MTAMTITGPSKLPLFRTIGQAYALWARNFSDLVRICWFWMLLMVPILAIWDWWQTAQLAEIVQGIRFGQAFVDPHPVLTWVTVIVSKLIMLPAVASVAVAWHRLLLRDEHPGPGFYLRLDKTVAGYADSGVLDRADHYGAEHCHHRAPKIMTGSGGTAAAVIEFLVNVAVIVASIYCAEVIAGFAGHSVGTRRRHAGDCVAGQQTRYLANGLGLLFSACCR